MKLEYLSDLLGFKYAHFCLKLNEICIGFKDILRSDTRHKSLLFHMNVFYAIMEDN